jgi:dTDP-4-dehydrorhamnose reductase
MLGRDLMPVLAQEHVVLGLDHAGCDITNISAVQEMVDDWRPEVIVNCAAFPDVDACERDPERAFAVNGRGAGNLARSAERVGARLFHIGTDYVFDGAKRTPYNENDPVNPISKYGASKLDGEKQVLADGNGGRHLVLRTSWLYGIHKTNFVDRTLEQAKTKHQLQSVADQISCPTWTLHLSQKIAELVMTSVAGIIHVAGSGTCSRHEFAEYIVQQLTRHIEVKPITWAQLNLPAKRPAYSVLGSEGLRRAGLAPLPDWKQAVDEYLRVRQAVPVP